MCGFTIGRSRYSLVADFQSYIGILGTFLANENQQSFVQEDVAFFENAVLLYSQFHRRVPCLIFWIFSRLVQII